MFCKLWAKDTEDWFTARGVALKAESDGRMFPVTDESQSIIDCLTTTANQLGVTLKCNSQH